MTPARDREALDQAIVRGSELLKQGKLDQAQRAFRAALDIEPDNPKVLALLGLSHFRASQFAEARPIYEDLVELAPTDASHRLNLGLVYLKLNDAEHAITALEASRALDPSQGRAVSYLGLAYARAGRYAEAYRSFLLAGQNELATEIEINLTPAERDGIHSQLGRTPSGPLPVVARAVTPPAVSRTVTPPAVARAVTPHLIPRTSTPSAPPTPTPPPDDDPSVARTRSAPRTKPPSAPPKRAKSQNDLGAQATSAVELVAKLELPADAAAAADSQAEITIERTSERDIIAAEPLQVFDTPAPEPDEPLPMTVSQQFVLALRDDSAPRPVDGQSMVSHAVAIAAPSSTTATRTVTGGLAARPLSELATEDLVRPDDATDVFEIGANGSLLVRITERVLTRLDGVHITGGVLSYEVANRRSRGHHTDERFDDGGTPLHAVSGHGYLIAVPGQRAFTAVALDDDILYIREDLVFAFEGTLRWENGNVPGLRGKLHVVQFRGDGALVLRLERPLVRVKLPPQGLVFVDAERLAGWIGRVIPRAVVPPSGGPLGTMCVECTGEGIVLVEPAPAPVAGVAPSAAPEPEQAPSAEAAPAGPPTPPPELADFAAAMREASDPGDEI